MAGLKVFSKSWIMRFYALPKDMQKILAGDLRETFEGRVRNFEQLSKNNPM